MVGPVGYAGLFLADLTLAGAGLTVADVHQTISPVWPAMGLAIGVLALWGPRLWPVVFLAEFVADYLFAGNPPIVSACIAVADTVQAILGALALRRLGAVGEVARIRDALAILLVATVTPIPAASLGVLSLTLGGLSPWSDYVVLWLVWWVGNSTGTLVILPLALAWAGKPAATTEPARPLEFAGALMLAFAALYAANLYSTSLARLGVEHLPITTFLSIPLAWAVLRLRPREALTVVAEAAALAVVWALVMAPGQPIGALLWLQAILLSLSGASLLLVGAMTERAALRAAEQARAVAEAARKQAEQANIAKSAFLAAASHDLRQPAQSLVLLTEALSAKLNGRPEASIATHITHATNAFKEILDGILNLSRIDAGIITPNPENFVLGKWMTQLEGESTVQARSKGLTLKFVTSSCWVRSDPKLLASALRNLIDNAIKFTSSGKVLVGCRRTASSVRIEVHDSGIGIAPEDLEMVFEEFHQLGNPERDRRKGLGLGLSVVRRLSLLLDHPLTVRSTPGQGSCFCLVVPRMPSQIARRAVPVATTGQ